MPAAFIATTENVYATPLVSQVKVQVSKLVLVHPLGAVVDGDEETLYPVIADPPSEVGALQLITA